MTRSALSFCFTALLLSVALCSSCSSTAYTNSKVDQCLKAADAASSNNDPQTAEQQLHAAVDLAEDSKGVPLMKALNALSLYYREHGKFELCSDLLVKAKSIGDQLLESNPAANDVSEFQTEYLVTMYALANWERDMGHFSTARRYYGIATSINEKLGDKSPVKDTLSGDFRKCISEQEAQEGVENQLASGKEISRKKESKNNTRRKFSLEYKSIMDGYDSREPRESEEMFVSLVNAVRKEFGLDEPFYSVALSGLLDITTKTGNFFRIEQILDEDIQSMKSLDAKTMKGVRVGPAEVVELGNFVDTLLWQSRVASMKTDYTTADLKAARALRLTEEYYPESGARLEECWRSLQELRAARGDFKSSIEIANRSVKELERRDPRSAFLHQHYYDLALAQLGQGQITQAVAIADLLLKRPSQSLGQKHAYTLTALRILFEVESMIGDYEAAGKSNRQIAALVNQNKRLQSAYGLALIYQAHRLLFDRGKFAEYIRDNERHNFDRVHYYYQWLFDSDVKSYAALRAGKTDKAVQYCKNVESAKRDQYIDSLFYSRIVRVWLDASVTRKKTSIELDKSVSKLESCIEKLSYPSRFFAVKPLTDLANHLTDSGCDAAALRVYSCALSAYSSLPSRVDRQLIEALAGYRKLLEKLNRREEAWQMGARLEQKREKFAALVSITKDTLKQANLL